MIYKVPQEYFFRLHHIRPRFKDNVENVLIYVASEISKIPESNYEEYKNLLNNAIRHFPGNAIVTEKTINNWRTEISSLFGLLQFKEDGKICRPGKRALELASEQELISAFRRFLIFFQYPGAHLKPHEIKKCIDVGINFKPVEYILDIFIEAQKKENKKISINKAELTHCVFNDLRCTRDNQLAIDTWLRIKRLRENNTEFDSEGDIVRYAGDILDYMVFADILKYEFDHNYYLNPKAMLFVEELRNKRKWFNQYDSMIRKRCGNIEVIKQYQDQWFDFVNSDVDHKNLDVDIFSLLPNYKRSEVLMIAEQKEEKTTKEEIEVRDNTKEIGDQGEFLIHGHECEKLKQIGRSDLVHLVKVIPSQFAVGYDIQSFTQTDDRKHIEVKTTVSNNPITFDRVHLTSNEYRAAQSYKEKYYIYRLSISRKDHKLFVMPDPIGLYKQDKIQMIPSNDGADLMFDSSKVGYYEELLSWSG